MVLLMRGGPDQASLLRLTYHCGVGGEKPAKLGRGAKRRRAGSSAFYRGPPRHRARGQTTDRQFVKRVTPPPDAIRDAAPPPRDASFALPRGSLGSRKNTAAGRGPRPTRPPAGDRTVAYRGRWIDINRRRSPYSSRPEIVTRRIVKSTAGLHARARPSP